MFYVDLHGIDEVILKRDLNPLLFGRRVRRAPDGEPEYRPYRMFDRSCMYLRLVDGASHRMDI